MQLAVSCQSTKKICIGKKLQKKTIKKLAKILFTWQVCDAGTGSRNVHLVREHDVSKKREKEIIFNMISRNFLILVQLNSE